MEGEPAISDVPDCVDQPALVATAVEAEANHQLLSTVVLQNAIGVLSAASKRLALALVHSLLLLSPRDKVPKTGISKAKTVGGRKIAGSAIKSL